MTSLSNDDFSPNKVQAEINKMLADSEFAEYEIKNLYVTEYRPYEAHITITHKPSGGALSYRLQHAQSSTLNEIYNVLLDENNFSRILKYVPRTETTIFVTEDLNSNNPFLADRHLFVITNGDEVYYGTSGFALTFDDIAEDVDNYTFFQFAQLGVGYDIDKIKSIMSTKQISDFSQHFKCTRFENSKAAYLRFFVQQACLLARDVCKKLAEDESDEHYVYDEQHVVTRFSTLCGIFANREHEQLSDCFLIDPEDSDLVWELYDQTSDLDKLAFATQINLTPDAVKKFTKKLAESIGYPDVYGVVFPEKTAKLV